MNVKAIQLTGGGEPTVHPQFNEVVQAIIDRGIEFSLVSHGERFNDEMMRLLIKATWVRISVDAGCDETYGKIRSIAPKRYHTTMANIKRFVELKKETNSQVTIGTGFVVTKENWREVVMAVQQAKDNGVDNVRISAIFQSDDTEYFTDFYEEARELCKKAAELSTETFRVVNMFGDRVEDMAVGAPDYQHCNYMQTTTYLAGDLSVYRCCNTSYSKQGFIGSLKDQRFIDLWRSQAKKDNFDNFDARTCERCQFNNKNKAIERLVHPDLTHVNFV
jgi:MoaA/NifB/PqqE/SkfB family radical SAM enzyme